MMKKLENIICIFFILILAINSFSIAQDTNTTPSSAPDTNAATSSKSNSVPTGDSTSVIPDSPDTILSGACPDLLQSEPNRWRANCDDGSSTDDSFMIYSGYYGDGAEDSVIWQYYVAYIEVADNYNAGSYNRYDLKLSGCGSRCLQSSGSISLTKTSNSATWTGIYTGAIGSSTAQVTVTYYLYDNTADYSWYYSTVHVKFTTNPVAKKWRVVFHEDSDIGSTYSTNHPEMYKNGAWIDLDREKTIGGRDLDGGPELIISDSPSDFRTMETVFPFTESQCYAFTITVNVYDGLNTGNTNLPTFYTNDQSVYSADLMANPIFLTQSTSDFTGTIQHYLYNY